MEDRIVQFPNRIKLVPVDGQPNIYDIEEVPGEVTSEGTPLSKATLLTDVTGERYGLTPTGTIAEVLSKNVQELSATITATGWSSSVGDEGYFTNQVEVPGMLSVYNPLLVLVITSATLSEDERMAFSYIIEVETFDGYVICKALEVPDIDLNVKFMGV